MRNYDGGTKLPVLHSLLCVRTTVCQRDELFLQVPFVNLHLHTAPVIVSSYECAGRFNYYSDGDGTGSPVKWGFFVHRASKKWGIMTLISQHLHFFVS